jgi:hypothetical protein
MAFVLANNGIGKWLDDLTLGVRVRLFKNDETIDGDTALGDLTEADFSGYSAATVAQGTSSATGGVATNVLTPESPFEHDGGATANDIYGYYVTDASATVLYFAERFGDAPIDMASNGDLITVVVSAFTLSLIP